MLNDPAPQCNAPQCDVKPKVLAPFDHADADVILRSSEGTDFRVFKIILSFASTIFHDMVTLSYADGCVRSADGLPIVSIDENHRALDLMLRLIYPLTQPKLRSIGDGMTLGRLVDKYVMVDSAAQRTKELLTGRFLESDPLALYALACKYGWKAVAEQAALQTLKIKDLGRPSHYVKELEDVTGGDLHRLLTYHLSCGKAARDAFPQQSPAGKRTNTFSGLTDSSDRFFTPNALALLSQPHWSTLGASSFAASSTSEHSYNTVMDKVRTAILEEKLAFRVRV